MVKWWNTELCHVVSLSFMPPLSVSRLCWQISPDVLGVQLIPGRVRSPRGAQDPYAFPPGRGGQPAGQRGRIPDCVQLVH